MASFASGFSPLVLLFMSFLCPDLLSAEVFIDTQLTGIVAPKHRKSPPCRQNPLAATPRNPDQQREHSIYWKADEETLKKQLLRLFGCDGQLPGKLPAERSDGYPPRRDNLCIKSRSV